MFPGWRVPSSPPIIGLCFHLPSFFRPQVWSWVLFTLRGFDGRMFLVVSCCPSTCPLLASFVPQLSDVTYIYIIDISDKWYNLYLLHLSRTAAHRPGSRSSSLAATASSVQTNCPGTDWIQTKYQCSAGTRTRPATRYFFRYLIRPDSVLEIIG